MDPKEMAVTLNDIMTACDSLKRSEVRTIQGDQADLVVDNTDLSDWQEKLIGFLGQPNKQPGTRPDATAKALSKPFGGIQKEQTLFSKLFYNHCIIAMFWPWQNNQYTTLKLFVISKDDYQEMIKPGFFSKLL